MDDVRVIFVHGLANKPPPADLQRIWLEALACPVDSDDGFSLGASGVSDSFVYWADLFYETPLAASHYESAGAELSASLQGAKGLFQPDDWTNALCTHYPEADGAGEDPIVDETLPGYERIPLPGFVKQALMAEFVREAHDYLFDVGGVRETIRARLLAALNACPEGTRRVVAGHSQGTFIAYDVLTGVADCPPVDGFMTIGSPLGVDEVQDRLVWSRENGFPSVLRGDWVNVFDPLDVVSRPDPHLANDFRKAGVQCVIDVAESNWGMWRHSATKYFKGPKLRAHLRRLCNRENA